MSSDNAQSRDFPAELVQICDALVRKFARFNSFDEALREDVVQESWLELVRSIGTLAQLDDQLVLSAWIRKIVQSKTADAARRLARERNLCVSMSSLDWVSCSRDTGGAEEREKVARIRNVLGELRDRSPPTTWEAVKLCLIDGLPPREAALQLGMSAHQVSKRLTTARRVFRVLWRHSHDGAAPPAEPF